MSNLIKQIYPHTPETEGVKISGIRSTPYINRREMDTETWNNLPEFTKYQIGMAGLMMEDPVVEIATVSGGIFHRFSGIDVYTVGEFTPSRSVSLTYTLSNGTVKRTTEVHSIHQSSSDSISIVTESRQVGFYPSVHAVTPTKTTLQYIHLYDIGFLKKLFSI